MKVQASLSKHAADRIRERLNIEDPIADFQSIRRFSNETVFLKQGDWNDNKLVNFRLCYFPSSDVHAVLVTESNIQDGFAIHHLVITVITVDMYEERNGAIAKVDTCRAAQARLGHVAYRAWSAARYGCTQRINSGRLHVYFKDSRAGITAKIRRPLCEGFRLNEPYEASLAHPGALSAVHQELAKFGRRLNDRLYMRFDSEVGPLKMTEYEASPCPYCGMEPLPTDTPATHSVKPSKAM
jgi:hypothetical protein